MEIIKREVDVAGKYRILVKLSESDAQSFKFISEPTDAEVLEVAARYVEDRDKQVAETTEQERTRLTLEITAMQARLAELTPPVEEE